MFKGKIIPKILEILQAQAESTADLLDIFTSGYYSSYRKMKKSMIHGPRQFKTDWAEWYKKRQQFFSLLNQLKNQGLVGKETSGRKKTIWRITGKGTEKLSALKKSESNKKINVFKEENDDKLKVVIFDIPEEEKEKRRWIRETLYYLGFRMLQKSVWFGKKKIPEKLIFELKKRGMMSYVHIFKIDQKGSIGHKIN